MWINLLAFYKYLYFEMLIRLIWNSSAELISVINHNNYQ